MTQTEEYKQWKLDWFENERSIERPFPTQSFQTSSDLKGSITHWSGLIPCLLTSTNPSLTIASVMFSPLVSVKLKRCTVTRPSQTLQHRSAVICSASFTFAEINASILSSSSRSFVLHRERHFFPNQLLPQEFSCLPRKGLQRNVEKIQRLFQVLKPSLYRVVRTHNFWLMQWC